MGAAQQIYDEMWEKSLRLFQAGKYETDPQILSDADTRRGLTVLSRISGETGNNIEHFLGQLETVEPGQYYYPATDLHLTVISVIACYEDFKLSDVDPAAYIQAVENALADIKPLQIELRGITASPSCILVQGFPVDNQLGKLRENLRREFNGTALQSSIDSRYTIATAHSTVARFQQPVSRSQELISLLSEYRGHPFGTLEIDRIELVFNDWYQKAATTQKLQIYAL